MHLLRTNIVQLPVMYRAVLCKESQNTDFLLYVFQGVPYVEGNGMSGLYKLQVKAALTAQYTTFSLIRKIYAPCA